MNTQLRKHADLIVRQAIDAVLPDAAVKRALAGQSFPGKIILVAAGKAGWQMAKTAWECLGERIDQGIVITKYDHVKHPIGNLTCLEAGHPVPDENSFAATLSAQGINIAAVLQDNDAYHALQRCEGLIITGPTGTNVNDVAVALLQP